MRFDFVPSGGPTLGVEWELALVDAATLGLVRGAVPDAVECVLPNTTRVRFTIRDGQVDGDHAHAVSIKDAGDDPDATHGARLTADVRRIRGGGGVVILAGGPGVGVVTKPGLGLAVGGPAINPVPRRNIIDNVRAAGTPIRGSPTRSTNCPS